MTTREEVERILDEAMVAASLTNTMNPRFAEAKRHAADRIMLLPALRLAEKGEKE